MISVVSWSKSKNFELKNRFKFYLIKTDCIAANLAAVVISVSAFVGVNASSVIFFKPVFALAVVVADQIDAISVVIAVVEARLILILIQICES